MYIEITSVNFNAEEQVVTIGAMDLDTIITCSWDQEIATMNAEKKFVFNLKEKGASLYLFKICKSNVTPKELKDCKSNSDMLQKMVGKMTMMSDNFLEKIELSEETKKANSRRK